MKTDTTVLTEKEMMSAWQRRDSSYDGVFFLGVRTTGIFCQPSCPSQPRREHLDFFRNAGDAIRAGYRPCKRCQPELSSGKPPSWVVSLLARVAESPDEKITARDLRRIGVAPERARRWFQKHHGMTFAAWWRNRRLSDAFAQIRNGAPVDDAILGHGYESHSGFRTAFARAFGKAPGRARHGDYLCVALFETPLGPMLAAASNDGVRQLEFADVRGMKDRYVDLRRRYSLPVLPGENSVMEQLRVELQEYFRGERRRFTVPVILNGTDFQRRVWQELRQIPYGRTASYQSIARRINRPSAIRAVARANGGNRLYLLVPCHRVIAKDGTLSGYGGGKWRKRLLLELEQTRKHPN